MGEAGSGGGGAVGAGGGGAVGAGGGGAVGAGGGGLDLDLDIRPDLNDTSREHTDRI